MSETWVMRSVAVAFFVAAALNASMPVEGRAERVGYAFQGALTPSNFSANTHTYKLFGVTVPDTSPIAGTFSYDTTAVGVTPFAGAKSFKQTIQCGFNWNILNAADQSPVLRLSASEYSVTVANDFLPSGFPAAIDYFSVDFNSLSVPAPQQLLVNGLPYTKPTAVVSAPLSWDWPRFDDDELRAVLPQESFFSYTGITRSSLPVTFGITTFSQIVPSAGDYNLDGRVDPSDYVEWRRAFGGSSTNFAHADGNADGNVDAADYVAWRSANGSSLAAGVMAPEPRECALIAVAALILASFKRMRLSCC